MSIDERALRAIVADGDRVVPGADIPERYLSDALGRRRGAADALVFPLSTEEVSGVLRYAHAHRIPVTPRGAGTNLVGSTVPVQGGILLDLSRMDRVLELDEDTMTLTVEPGILLQDVQAYVEARGLFYPPGPGEKAASIGGNISTNAGGMREVKYGVTRDYVRGLEVVLADGALDYLVLTDPAQAADIWKARGALVKAVEAVSEQEPVDIVVPISRTAEFAHSINELETTSGVQMIAFGHAGDGSVHLCVVRGDRDEETWQRALHETMDAAYAEAYRLGGVASGEHGIGLSKRRYYLRETAAEDLAAMGAIKDALDPLHILNDQKAYIQGGTDHAETV